MNTQEILQDIKLTNVKVVIGWANLIKHKYTKYLGSLNYGNIAIFQGPKTIYMFSDLPLDDYKLGEVGLSVEKYYSAKPSDLEVKYRLVFGRHYFSDSEIKKLYDLKILTDEIYQRILSEEKERTIAYCEQQIQTMKKNIEYYTKKIEESLK